MRRTSAVAASFLLLAGCGESPPQPANVVVVLADTLRAENLGTYGYHRDTSPHLTDFAEDAFLFEDTRAQAPCTFPSANSILTGRDPSSFWAQPEGRMGIPEGVPSLAELLRERGYATVAVSASPIVREHPTRFNPHGGFDRGFDVFDERCLHRKADCVNRVALEYLSVLREPFFLYLHYMDPHDPYEPPEAERTWSEADGYDDRPDAKWFVTEGNPNPLAEQVYGDEPPDFEVKPADVDHLVNLYDDEIAYFDRHFGALIETLRRPHPTGSPGAAADEDDDAEPPASRLDRTIVALVADHGESFFDHGHVKHCRSLYDAEIRTPFALRLPGAEGGRIAEPVQNLDLVPTILDTLGFEAPEVRFDGASLRPLLDEGVPVHEHVTSSWGTFRAAKDERFKLVMNLSSGEVELYDLEADPGETENVADAHPRETRRLQGVLSAWIREVEGKGGAAEALDDSQAAQERLRALGYMQ